MLDTTAVEQREPQREARQRGYYYPQTTCSKDRDQWWIQLQQTRRLWKSRLDWFEEKLLKINTYLLPSAQACPAAMVQQLEQLLLVPVGEPGCHRLQVLLQCGRRGIAAERAQEQEQGELLDVHEIDAMKAHWKDNGLSKQSKRSCLQWLKELTGITERRCK